MDDTIDLLVEAFMTGAVTPTVTTESLKFIPATIELLKDMWNYLMIVAISFTLIYFLLDVNRRLAFEGGDFTMKTMIMPFIKFCAAYGLLSRGAIIASGLLGWHNAFVEKTKNDFFNPSSTPPDVDTAGNITAVTDILHALPFWSKVFLLLPLLIMWIVTLILSLVWTYKALSFKIEMIYRVGVTPIALADIYSGQNANAIRWIKGTVAFTLYGASLILIPKIGTAIQGTEFLFSITDGKPLTALGAMLKMLVIPFAELGVLSAIKQTAKEALG